MQESLEELSVEELEQLHERRRVEREKEDAFWEEERQRLANGVPSLDVLNLQIRTLSKLSRLGVRTVVGVEEMLHVWNINKRFPKHIGPKTVRQIQEAHDLYIKEHPPVQPVVTFKP